MTSPLLAPGTADALLFDLGRVVLDIDFNRTLACWAGHAGCEAAHLVGRFARDELYRRHEKGEIGDAEFFAGLRASLGVELSDAQLLEGWNAIFAGEMPGIAQLLARAAQRLPLYAFSNTNSSHVEYFSQRYADVLGQFSRNVSIVVDRASETGRAGL
jgi:putative hydrolase of the HAD superfamily